MSNRIPFVVIILLSALFSFTACSGSGSDASPLESAETLDLGYEVLPLGPNEIIHIAGDISVETSPFQLEGAGGLNVFWRQTCSNFVLSMRNTNPTLAEAPLGTVFFESILEPTEYVEPAPWKKPFEYVPGEYKYVITAEGNDCQWEVWATITDLEGQ